jgi:sigma-E factor negative regulatory protein RseB
MKRVPLSSVIVASLLLLFTSLSIAIEAGGSEASTERQEITHLSAIDHLNLMQQAYQNKNYEMVYLSSLQNQLEPMQLIHGVVDGLEASYFRYLNGVIRESLKYAGKISYFEQGQPAYTLESNQNSSVFANFANYDFEEGKSNYDYVILGKGRIAGKAAIAIRMISRDDYRYSYVVWCDLKSSLPLRLDTINKSNVIIEQLMVVALNISEVANPWLIKLTQNTLPEVLHVQHNVTNSRSQWKANWIPPGFSIAKDDQHRLAMHENELVSYILLDDGLSNVSIYVSDKKIVLDEQQKLIRRGATVFYTEQQGKIEVNVVGDIPVATAKRLAQSIEVVNNTNDQ